MLASLFVPYPRTVAERATHADWLSFKVEHVVFRYRSCEGAFYAEMLLYSLLSQFCIMQPPLYHLMQYVLLHRISDFFPLSFDD